MTFENLKKIAVDSNVILSAVIGKAALKIFTSSSVEFITTRFNLSEVEEYLPKLAQKYCLEINLLVWQFNMLPLKVYPTVYYEKFMPSAQKLLDVRDPEDAHLLALALRAEVPILSNNHDFDGLPVPVFSTARLLAFLNQAES